MLNQLKKAIRKKALYFVVDYSTKNIEQLYNLLASKIIVSFTVNQQKSIIVLINYCHDFSSSISNVSVNSNKLSKQQNNIMNYSFIDSNFTVHIHLTGKKKYNLLKKPKHSIKFR